MNNRASSPEAACPIIIDYLFLDSLFLVDVWEEFGRGICIVN